MMRYAESCGVDLVSRARAIRYAICSTSKYTIAEESIHGSIKELLTNNHCYCAFDDEDL